MKSALIWIIGLAIAIVAGLTSMGAIAKNKAPALAVTLRPLNGFAAENLAATYIRSSMGENQSEFPDHLTPTTTQVARRAFLAEPITPEAVAILALGRGDGPRRKLMNMSLLLSRRQLLVTAWMIADSGSRGDIPELLNYYDTILRTSRSAASAVIPVLARALANDDFIAPFADFLRTSPPWANQFWGTVTSTPDSLGNAARLREALHKTRESDEAYRDAALISSLIGNQQFETAFGLYRLIVGQKKAGLLVENGTFETQPLFPPLDWQLISTGEYGATIKDGKLELSAIRNSGGLFARQLVNLPAQTLTMDVIPASPIDDATQIFINLSCAQSIKNMPQVVRIPLKKGISNLRIDNFRSGCSFYWLDIGGRASEDGDGFDVTLESFNIVAS